MSSNNSHQAIVDNRRRLVASLRLRGATQREIVNQLAISGNLNHKTGNPWSLNTINLDLQAIAAEWRAEAQRDIAEHKARQLAELTEVKRSAWSSKDLDVVLKAIKQESDILGTNEPSKTEHTGPGGTPLSFTEVIVKVKHDEPMDN